MTKVFALEACDYEDHFIVGIFRTQEAAEDERRRIGKLRTWASGPQSWALEHNSGTGSYVLHIRRVDFHD